MEPVSAIGLAGALVGIGDVITRSIRSLMSLQSKYRSASLVVSSLIGQLTTLKAALNQINQVVSGSVAKLPLHGQLVDDLRVSLGSCHVLMFVLEERIEGLDRNCDQTGGNDPSAKGKAKFLLEESSLHEFNTYLSSQVNALDLLLSALNCRTTFERTELLRNDESRRIFKRVEDDRTSLLTHEDVESKSTRMSLATETFSLLDLDFNFDQEVLTSDIYRAAWRSNLRKDAIQKGKLAHMSELPSTRAPPQMKSGIPEESFAPNQRAVIRNDARTPSRKLGESWGRKKTHIELQGAALENLSVNALALPSLSTKKMNVGEAEKESKNIWKFWPPNKKLFTLRGSLNVPGFRATPAEPNSKPPREHKVLLLGTSESGKSTLLKTAKLLFHSGYSLKERQSFRESIFSNTVQAMRLILEAMESLELPLDDKRNECHVQTIFMQPAQIEGERLSPEVPYAIRMLWKDSGVKAVFERSREYRLYDNAAYYFESMDRLEGDDYIPTDSDIIMSWIKTTGLLEHKFQTDEGITKIYDLGGGASERKMWIHTFENVDVVIFHVDIACYDQLLFGDETQTRMQESLLLFDSIINSRWFLKTSFILHFTKMDKLAAKIAGAPLKDYFPDFEKDGENIGDVKAYIASRFLGLSRNPEKSIRVIYTSFIDGYEADARKVFDSISGAFHDD